ncbi:MAG TPA: hypothetical protein VF868_08055 [Bacteroidia bacterium]|jgi:hypothetical protein
MKLFKRFFQISLSLVLVLLFSCKKEAGEGGKASIYGNIWVKKYNALGTLEMGEYAGAFEEVFIVYGDDASYGDKVEANPEGKYEFKYLRPGNYKIYAYSKDSTGDYSASKFAVIKEVKISKKKEAVDAGTIKVFTYQQ